MNKNEAYFFFVKIISLHDQTILSNFLSQFKKDFQTALSSWMSVENVIVADCCCC